MYNAKIFLDAQETSPPQPPAPIPGASTEILLTPTLMFN